jgi:hypothetical protein
MTTLGLDSPPDLDDDLLPEQIWRDDAMRDFLRALEERLGVPVSATDVSEARTFAGMAVAVHRAVSGRQRSEGRL